MTTLRMNSLAFGIAMGILWAIAAFGISVLAATFLSGVQSGLAVGSLAITYTPSLAGSLVFTGLGLLGGFVAGYVFSRLYNLLANKL